MLTLFSSGSSPIVLISVNDERFSIGFDKGQHAVTCWQIPDVVTEV